MKRSASPWLGLLMAGIVSSGHAAAAPVEWTGFINCGILPGLTHYNLHQPVTVVVADGRANIERHVLRADTTQETAYIERSGGVVAPDGTVTLTGGATVGRQLSYSSSYFGRLAPGGGTTSLVGSQLWVGAPLGHYDRPCHIDLSR